MADLSTGLESTLSGNRPEFVGVFANTPTPFTPEGDLDLSRIRDHVRWSVEQGVHGISCLLSIGEFTYLTSDERAAVVGGVVDAVAGRVPVVAGVSGSTTEETIRLAMDAEAAGADALMVQPRSYIPLLPDELLRHFQLVAEAVETPIGIYNNPEATGVEITPSLYCSIIENTGAVVTKDAGDDLFNIPDIRDRCGDRFHYLWGNITLLPAALALGADGCCVALASVLPRAVVDLYDASREHKLESDPSAYNRLLPLFRALNSIGTNPRSIKALANLRGLSLGGHRDPVTVLPEAHQQLLREALAELGTV